MSLETLSAGNTLPATELSAFKASMPIAGATAEAASMGAVAPAVIGTIASTAFLVGGVFFAYKGVQAVVTGKNPFKKESFA